jgi:predicted dehydrogenase
MTYRIAVIGTGADPEERDREGYAMAYRHAPGYQRLEECTLVGCADIVPENAAAFADRFDLDGVYTDHESLLREEAPDIVSVCVPPAVHAEIVVDCAEYGDVEAIHCEKPMATKWGDCKEMIEACEAADVQLTIDHQRRFSAPVGRAKQLVDADKIGELRRLEWSEVNLFDAGSHLFDLCDHFTDGGTPEWVLAGVDPDPDNRWFGALNEGQAIAQWEYSDGTQGFASTGEGDRETLVDAYLRLVGEDGCIEIQADDGSPLRIRTDGGWRTVDTGGETVYGPGQTTFQAATNKIAGVVPGVSPPYDAGPTHYERAIEHLVTCLDHGREPLISGKRVLRGTELVFASWESAWRRERVSLPLDISDNPLEALCTEKFGTSVDSEPDAPVDGQSPTRDPLD